MYLEYYKLGTIYEELPSFFIFRVRKRLEYSDSEKTYEELPSLLIKMVNV